MCDPLKPDPYASSVDSLCPDGVCQNGTKSEIQVDNFFDDTKSGCSKSDKESMIYSSLSRCDYYEISQVDCVEYIKAELDGTCGGYHNCIQTGVDEYASWKTYSNWTNKYVTYYLACFIHREILECILGVMQCVALTITI